MENNEPMNTTGEEMSSAAEHFDNLVSFIEKENNELGCAMILKPEPSQAEQRANEEDELEQLDTPPIIRFHGKHYHREDIMIDAAEELKKVEAQLKEKSIDVHDLAEGYNKYYNKYMEAMQYIKKLKQVIELYVPEIEKAKVLSQFNADNNGK